MATLEFIALPEPLPSSANDIEDSPMATLEDSPAPAADNAKYPMATLEPPVVRASKDVAPTATL